MRAWLRELALCFAAGCGGGFMKSAVAWGVARLGVGFLHGGGAFGSGVLYPRVVWGGLWAFLFVLPFLRGSVLLGGVLAAAIVTVMQWVVLPLWWHGGLHLALWPLLEGLVLNLIWGLVAALLLKWL